MNINNWAPFNPKIRQGYTVKRYFNKYLYKMIVYAPGGRLSDKDGSISVGLARRSGYVMRHNRNLHEASVELLECLRELRNDSELPVKIVISEPWVSFYSVDEQTMLDLVKKRFNKKFYHYIRQIHGPESDKAAELLSQNAILRKARSEYTHKIVLKDGIYDAETKNRLKAYLDGLGTDQVKIPKAVAKALTKNSLHVWGMYIYSNDPSIATFIDIIHPGLVRNCHELSILDTK